MGKPIGGNPLRNAAIRQGEPWQSKAIANILRPHKVKRSVYTEVDRKRLLAPIAIRAFGGKAYSGISLNRDDQCNTARVGGRYGFSSDWADLDRLS